MINNLFPFKLHLRILQLEEYKPGRFLRWIVKNFLVREISSKKKLVTTTKVKYIIFISLVLFLALPLIIGLATNNIIIIVIFFLFFLAQPYIVLTLAVFVMKPYEIYNRQKTIEETRRKVLSFKNLKVIGITGSFGKSSTKEILYQLIKRKYKVLRTPESYNTLFGVAKVIDYELNNSYEYFICEMAAYKIGEVKELCYMVPPTYGILTGITTQHFERFGSLENTIKAKFELVEAVSDKSKVVFNLEDENIKNKITRLKFHMQAGRKNITIKNVKFDKNGSEFDLVINQKTYHIKTALFGFAQIKNITLAVEMALKLGLSEKELVEGICNLKPFDNRQVLIQDRNATIVNNTYSSNPQGFKETIKTAKLIKGKKVLITPGLVELGKVESQIHLELGKLLNDVFDEVILVGENNRTKSMAKNLKGKFEFIPDNRDVYFKKIEELKRKYDWIFLENDVTENY